MASNYKAPGDTLTLTAPYDVDSGEGAKVGAIFGVAQSDVASGAEGEFKTEGVHELVKDDSAAWAAGDRIYWNDSTKECANDSAAGMLIGYATEAALEAADVGNVKLCGVASDLSEGPQAAIADLTAITGGEVPTEAEHNLVVAKVNALLAALRLAGMLDT